MCIILTIGIEYPTFYIYFEKINLLTLKSIFKGKRRKNNSEEIF